MPQRSARVLTTCCALAAMLVLIAAIAAGGGIIRPAGRYFQTEQGEPFIVIGQNDAPGWPYLDAIWSKPPAEADKIAGDYLRRLEESGVNTIRIFAEYPVMGMHLQNPDGSLVEENWQKLDRLFYLADRHGIYILLGPWDPFWVERTWKDYPMNAARGGPMKDVSEFFTSPQARVQQRERLRQFALRFGGRRNLLAWEILNEADLWWHPTPQKVTPWFSEMAAWIRECELNRWGTAHMVAASAGTPNPKPEWREFFYRNPNMDFVSTHMYYLGVADPAAGNPTDAIIHVREGMKFQYAQIGQPPRPFLETESGPIEQYVIRNEGPPPRKLDEEVYHHVSWALLAAGGAGQALRWPYLNPHTLTAEMHRLQRIMRNFTDRFPWKGFEPRAGDEAVALAGETSGIVTAASCGAGRALIFLARRAALSPKNARPLTAEIRLPCLAGEYILFAMDTRSGNVLADKPFSHSGGNLKFEIPAFASSLAVGVFPKSVSGAAADPWRLGTLSVHAAAKGGGPLRHPMAQAIGSLTGCVELDSDKTGMFMKQLAVGPYLVRACARDFLPANREALLPAGGVKLTLELLSEQEKLGSMPNTIYKDGFSSASGIEKFWSPSIIQGARKGSYGIEDGQLVISNPKGSRFGLMSQPLPVNDRAFYFEGQLNSFSGENCIISIYCGDGEFNNFVEHEITPGMVNLWSFNDKYRRHFIPSRIPSPLVVRIELSAPDASGARDIRAYHDGTLLYEVKQHPWYGRERPVRVFLYGWDSTVKWDWAALGQM
ncbi:MAG: cellulase family glycosylhydrolase [Candidatus Sumerlaeota bacterium]|nr:cellulase family glycosylhydrolase [Candidatus Sumerlaeota bacterium]